MIKELGTHSRAVSNDINGNVHNNSKNYKFYKPKSSDSIKIMNSLV